MVVIRNLFKRVKNMNKTAAADVQSDDPKTLEQFKNFIENDNVMMAVYKDDSGTMYVALSDRNDPRRCVVVTAEAMCKSNEILGDVFATKSTVRVEQILN